ncbi:MAG: beta-lactamase family protein [Clostridium sp.]|nr:beta-lactamase family protein [Clostridium sp.]MCM1208628.1 beta-lactamase family protein [Ruminococcus sp.]
MGIGLDVKFMDFLLKYASGKTDDMPLYQGNDVPYFLRADENTGIKRTKPYKKGVSNAGIKKLFDTLSRDESVGLAGFGMMTDGEVIAEAYNPPYNSRYRHVSFSMCKSVVSMAVGIAEHEGLLKLDERLVDIFKASNNVFMKREMKGITIENLLTMQTGVCFDEVSSAFALDWCREYMSSDFCMEPGAGFSYNSLNTYMLAAIIVKRSGKLLMDYLKEKLFDDMEIKDITWDKCPMGIEKGGFGMKLSIIDMLKLGQLYLSYGKWMVNGEEKQLVPKKWIEESTRVHVTLGRDVIDGYGYQIWRVKDGSILFNGVFGQNVYINRDRNLVIATTASAYDIFPDGKIVNYLCDFAAEDKNFINESIPLGAVYDFGDSIISGANKLAKGFYGKLSDNQYKNKYRQYFNDYLGVEYKFDEYAGSIIPVMIQGVYSIYSSGITALSIGFQGDVLYFKVCEENTAYKIMLGYKKEEPYQYQILKIKGKDFPIAAAACIALDEDGRPLIKIRIVYLEEVGSMTFKLIFGKGRLKLKALEIPKPKRVAGKLAQEEYIKKKEIKLSRKKTLEPPEYVKYKANKVLAPVVIGKPDV